jgi:hypothetical protein
LPFPLGIAAAEIMITVAITLFLGLIWNKWAGGNAGFLLGAICCLRSATYALEKKKISGLFKLSARSCSKNGEKNFAVLLRSS